MKRALPLLLLACSPNETPRVSARPVIVNVDAGPADAAPPKLVVADAGPSRPVRAAFERVLPLGRARVGVFPVGPRALVARGPRFVGYAEPRKPFVTDATLSRGLSTEAIDAPIHVAGRWPDVLTVHGHYGGSGGDPAYHAYLFAKGTWTRTGKPIERAFAAAAHGGGFAVFEPDSFYLENGMLAMPNGQPQYPCAVEPRHTFALAFGTTQKLTVPASFFPMSIGDDGAGKATAWGYVACEPGVHAGRAEGARLLLEVLPGTEVCTERDPSNGLTLAVAALFPASDGGAYALVGADVRYDERGVPYVERRDPPSRACMAAPLLLHRAAAGGWSKVGAPLPLEVETQRILVQRSTVDPAGTAWLATNRGTALRVAASGAVEEIGPTKTCLEADPEDAPTTDDVTLAKLVAPAPDDVWGIFTRGEDHAALCRMAAAAGDP